MKRALMLATAPFTGLAQGMASAMLNGKLPVTGSSAMAPMVEGLGKRFRTRHPGVVITDTLASSGSLNAQQAEFWKCRGSMRPGPRLSAKR